MLPRDALCLYLIALLIAVIGGMHIPLYAVPKRGFPDNAADTFIALLLLGIAVTLVLTTAHYAPST